MIDKKFICEKAIAHYGTDDRLLRIKNELANLNRDLALNNYEKISKNDMTNDIANLEIMLMQLRTMKKISDKEIEDEINFKFIILNNDIECDYD